MSHKLLLVDDEPFNLELMAELLQDAGYETRQAENGEIAWDILSQEGEQYSTVLLDKMMPGMSGFDVLKKIKAEPRLEFLPVIMQTAMGAAASVQEGLAAGAFYYLTKPFSRDMLLAIVGAAVGHWDRYARFRELANLHVDALKHLRAATFRCRNHREAQAITALLAKTCRQPERVATGLFELLVNAIEHGNLEISYEQKSQLIANGRWEQELESRLQAPEYLDREVTVEFSHQGTQLQFAIEDMGPGFDWAYYQDAEPSSLMNSHGRGILIARKLSFDDLRYQGKGNRVVALVNQED
ncbi:ATP-binding response regulator [Chromobacterium violaceum]|uniref:Response regulator receiver protein n=2 Tax=Chromobacterium violaceum TaxID=536 RepID=A0A1R0MAT7_CHRVL|nr:response regulator [Chromobacterium violaceum]AAQ58150.1 probable two-component response regulator [Chromobacterium violaceum ATCC 12472]ATP27313.1 response regulator receiver protein [Chromobacterium violaceum]ATP31229.1 response regulator receiver protein [Chromobacterium violaceum]KMN50410.1 response regulator receiver protein [Chromobacterium violaceum]KMN85492.1 response regulator receiver protein [Chromobacterium violaceum]